MQESGEMYLETILVIGKKKNVVRSIDVVEEMGFSKPSVSRAMAKLRSEDCIVMDENGYIALTEKGRSIAERIYERHIILTSILEEVGISHETASADACKIEHDLSDESFNAIKKHIENRK